MSAPDGTPVPQPDTELSDRDAKLLAFEAKHFNTTRAAKPGPKEAAIREVFECSATRYYQRLNKLLDSEAALKHYPVMINFLREKRERGRVARSIHGADR
jgi:hypothetical protein